MNLFDCPLHSRPSVSNCGKDRFNSTSYEYECRKRKPVYSDAGGSYHDGSMQCGIRSYCKSRPLDGWKEKRVLIHGTE